MEKIGNNEAQAQIMAWAECKGNELFNCFQKFEAADCKNCNGGQFHRQRGVSFGQIDSGLLQFVTQEMPKMKYPQLAMCMAIADNAISVLFETIDDDGNKSYYGTNDIIQSASRTLSKAARDSSARPAKRYGILPVVRDHLAVNWLGQTPGDIEKLFLSQKLTDVSDIEEKGLEDIIEGVAGWLEGGRQGNPPINLHNVVNEISDPFNRVAVRVMKYPIIGYNLEVLKLILKETSEIAITFAVNPADFYYNDDLFTLILEIGTGNTEVKAAAGKKGEEIEKEDDEGDETTFLDFVNACPPFCCGAPGQPPCPPD
ncbi:hypothetical protein BFP97_01545 [Roseivirga sp. 4D4]|uniref:hypothetical protein n=1 Tax=Roseivirga sp. 4D4 TaxID=1889784 RepID=UPI0008533A2D|nr:hypothetical protein [Roseivirga sp. 4D4]OEK00275.1 hypothetical protein BFP97_01545 [Roseivirga sp. 4D4]